MASAFTRSIKGDRVTWMIIIMLFLFSILAVFSSSSKIMGTSVFSPLLRQVGLIAIGLFIIYVFHNTPIALYRKVAIIGVILSIILLVYMHLFGTTINGARRWIRLFGFTFQPADVAKVTLIMYLAKIFEEGNLDSYKKVFQKIVVPVGLISMLIIISDTSTALLLGTCCICIMYIGGIKIRYIFYTIGIGICALLLMYSVDAALPGSSTRKDTALSRITAFLKKDSSKSNQPALAKAAVASGGIIGKGPGNSIQRHNLSESHSDYIYAINVEEYGLIGGVIILMAYLWLLYRGVMIAKKCSRMFPVILVLGFSLIITLQAIIHMGVSVGLLPVTGLTLPLVSHGGSSMTFMCLALGITLAVSRTADNQELSLEGLEQDEESTAAPQKLKA